ncbi:MAG: MurR/RpiR family transcriptional regulator [Christensenella sp.]|uniref:MurR/RpiR family transcriptional regulator n=1 Tax=Christensenella sp. TaxID=1935934 RepID=UPI002B2076E4|nr:MurR/RpiR family transcriptional regulator [Christensenella sp.]MEA5002862.1 MurR/RpiR family transcriptional regulator [Christensenella sp.]
MNNQSMSNNNQMSHSCLIKFKYVYDQLKSAERRAADFCLKNPGAIAHSTITAVAKSAGCSEATFFRLARRLGYSGYTELRSKILGNGSEQIVQQVGISWDDSIPTISKKVFETGIQALRDSFEMIDFELFEKAYHALLKSKNILFIGAGNAGGVAMAGAQKFFRMGFNTHYYPDFDRQLVVLSYMTKGDLLVCISHSGQTKSVCDIAKIAKKQNVPILAISNFPLSPLGKLADFTILTASFSYDITGDVISKRIPAMCILESLGVCTMMALNDEQHDNMEKANKILWQNKL